MQEAEEDLVAVLPILYEAEKALNSLSKSDLVEIRYIHIHIQCNFQHLFTHHIGHTAHLRLWWCVLWVQYVYYCNSQQTGAQWSTWWQILLLSWKLLLPSTKTKCQTRWVSVQYSHSQWICIYQYLRYLQSWKSTHKILVSILTKWFIIQLLVNHFVNGFLQWNDMGKFSNLLSQNNRCIKLYPWN